MKNGDHPQITVEGVSKIFQSDGREVTALADIDLTIGSNEFVSIVGPSGCGKSTLLSIVAGLESTTIGRVCLGDAVITRPSRERQVVFQEYGLFPWRTALKNVTIALEDWERDQRKVTDQAQTMLETVGLKGFERAYPAQLSGGMKQRVAIARALVTRPKALLMDEPFGALDALTRENLQDELLRIWALDPKTVLFITHNVEEAVYLSQRVVVMTGRPGRIKSIISVDQPYPRDRSFWESDNFINLRNHLYHLLHQDQG